MTIRVVVHRRHRFFRDGLADLLAARSGITVVGTATEAEEVLALLDGADVVLFDFVDDVAAAMDVSVEAVRHHPQVHPIAMCATDEQAFRTREAGMAAIVPATEGVSAVADAILLIATQPVADRAPTWRRVDGERSRAVLTARECEVITLVGSGRTTYEICEQLGISRKTVENHKQRIFKKLDVQNQAHAVATAVRHGLISLEPVNGLAREA